MRSIATIALIATLSALSQGCLLTSAVKESLDSCGTRTTLSDPEAAWRLDPQDPYEGGAVLAVRFARSARTPRSATVTASPADAPIVARYAWRAHAIASAPPIEIDSLDAPQDFRAPLGCPRIPIADPDALIPRGARLVDALLPPDRARLDGDARRIALEKDETTGGAIAAECLILPITFVIDAALLPFYAIGYGVRAIAGE